MYDDEDEDEDMAAAVARNQAWVSDDELAGLTLERASGFKSLNGQPESPVEQAARIIRDNAPLAAQTLVRLARYGESETVRMRAATEILTRAAALGTTADGRDPWDGVYEQVLVTRPPVVIDGDVVPESETKKRP